MPGFNSRFTPSQYPPNALNFPPTFVLIFAGAPVNLLCFFESMIASYRSFAEALKVDKKYSGAYFNRCSIFDYKKQYDAAITECSQAIKLGPGADTTMAGHNEKLGRDKVISDYYATRGHAYLKKDDLVHAFADLENAIRLNPDNGRALRTRGEAYEAKGDVARAQADYAAAKLFGE